MWRSRWVHPPVITAILGSFAHRKNSKDILFRMMSNSHAEPGLHVPSITAQNDPNETNVHRDVKESPYSYSCIFACGDYIRGDIVLYELRCKIELQRGDVLLFSDSWFIITMKKLKGPGTQYWHSCKTIWTITGFASAQMGASRHPGEHDNLALSYRSLGQTKWGSAAARADAGDPEASTWTGLEQGNEDRRWERAVASQEMQIWIPYIYCLILKTLTMYNLSPTQLQWSHLPSLTSSSSLYTWQMNFQEECHW